MDALKTILRLWSESRNILERSATLVNLTTVNLMSDKDASEEVISNVMKLETWKHEVDQKINTMGAMVSSFEDNALISAYLKFSDAISEYLQEESQIIQDLRNWVRGARK